MIKFHLGVLRKAKAFRRALRLGGLAVFLLYAAALFAWSVGTMYGDPAFAKRMHPPRHGLVAE